MFHVRAILLLSLLTTISLATPIDQVSRLRAARAESQLLSRQDQQALSTPVTFQTVTTSQTEAGTITTTCQVTLSPVTAADGTTQVLEEKQCKVQVTSGNTPPSSSNGGGNDTGQTSTAPASTGTATETQGQGTQTLSTSSPSATATTGVVPAISEIGVGTIPVSATGTVSASAETSSASATASASGSAPPAVSVIGTGQIPTSATGTVNPVPAASDSASASDSTSGTTPVTSVTTLTDGQVSTSIITPSAAAAEQAPATTPGQKLEVLPIGLGVFAGVSVIALIVVGLVTYERTKYRKAFRQRKLAEAGANMGYGGMAERT